MSQGLKVADLVGPIVIFGAGGFVGANLYRAIAAIRDDCYAVTQQPHVPWRLLGTRADRVLQCDVRNREDVDALFRRHPFRTIFVLSAHGAYSRQKDTARIYETNLVGLSHIAEAAKVGGFDALVHAGTSSEYGALCRGAQEGDPLHPNSHYAVSKVAAAYLLRYLAQSEGLPTLNLRLFSVYGPWEESDRFIPRLVGALLENRYPPLVDPDVSRDFVYADDAVEALILAATVGVKRSPGASINVASGVKTTISQAVDTARSLFGVTADPVWGTLPNRAWDLKEWYGNPATAEEVLGWRSRTSLAEGLGRTADWMRRHGSLPRVFAERDTVHPVRVSAIIACYRDARAIPEMHRRLTETFRALGIDYEIIFVNDASPDDTDAVLAELCTRDDRVIAVQHSRNFGSQSAFVSGMGIATGHAVVLMDGDLQDPPEIIPELFARWREGFEVVYGRRVRRDTSWWLGLCYKGFYRLFHRLAYIPIPVDAGDFSLMDRRVVEQLLELPETDQFLRGLRAWVGFSQTGVDYVRPERLFGRTTNSWRKNFWWARKAIFSFSFVPLETMLYGGLGLTFFAGIGLVVQFVYRLLHPEMPQGIATVIMLVLLFGGANLLAIAILGEYVGKVLDESKRRPKFIRSSIRLGKRRLVTREAIEGFVGKRVHTVPALLEQPA